jgi:hypothetical protein
MDHQNPRTLDERLAQASTSALNALDREIDVDQRLRDLYRAVGCEPDGSPRRERAETDSAFVP